MEFGKLVLVQGLVIAAAAGQATIHVPTDYGTIQAGIDAAIAGDTVLVDPGVYVETIRFWGKPIVVRSLAGPDATIIDGNANGTVVLFTNGEGPSSVLDGFTIRNGLTSVGNGDGNGGGIRCDSGSPTVRRCIIVDNIALWQTTGGWGGGVCVKHSAPTFVNCTIANNHSILEGGGIYALGPDAKPVLVNTIVWGNTANLSGAGIWSPNGALITANYCDIQVSGVGATGNFSQDPLFANAAAGNFKLLGNSPCIDAGDPASPPDPDCSLADMGALPYTLPWTGLASGLVGSTGIPLLTGSGTLLAVTPILVKLTNAKPFSPSWLIVGLSQINAPFKGGVMVPSVDLFFPLTTDFFGSSAFGGLWPSGVPSGTVTYFQWWIQDPGGRVGFAASNGLAATAP
jgi:hypothetical protein